MVDGTLPGDSPDFFIMRLDRRGGSIDDLLDSANADRNAQDRTAEFLSDGTAIGLGPTQLRDDRAEARAITGAKRSRQGGFVELTATGTVSPMQNEMDHFHFDRGKFDKLMGVEGLGIRKLGVATNAALRFDDLRSHRLKHHLPLPLVPLLRSGPAGRTLGGFLLVR